MWILKYQFTFLRFSFLILDFFLTFDWCQCFTSSYIRCVALSIFHIFTVVLLWIVRLRRLDLYVADLYGNYNTALWCCKDRLLVCDLSLRLLHGLHESLFLLLFFSNVGMCNDLLFLRPVSRFRHFLCSTSSCWSAQFFTLKIKARINIAIDPSSIS